MAVDAPSEAPSPAVRVRRSFGAFPGAAYVLLIVGYPLAWAAGLGPAVWILAAWPMLLFLVRRGTVEVPAGFILWLLFLGVMAASIVQVNSAGRMATFMLRSGWYVAAGIVLLYLVNQPTQRTVSVVVKSLVFLWGVGIVMGYLAIAFPDFGWTGSISAFLPQIVAENDFVSDLINPRLAEVQTFDDVRLGRPAAPYPYTNSWGSTFALLTPIVLAAIHERKLGLPRPLLVAMVILAIPPFIVALNRGAWITLGLGLIYGFVRLSTAQGNWKAIRRLAAVVVAGLVLALATGLAGTISDQLATRSEDSNEARLSIYTETIDAVAESPLLGYGTPRDNEAQPETAPLGTHGMLWMVLFSHGFLAAVFFTLFFVQAFLRYRGDTVIGHWAKVTLFIGLIQLPVYGHLPQQLFILMSAIALLIITPQLDPASQSRIDHRPA